MASQTDLARLVVSLEARIDKFDKAMAKAAGTANKTASQIEGRFSKMQANLNRLGSNLLAGFSAGVIARGLKDLITEIGNLGDEAKKAGVSIAQLQRLTFAALGSGVSSDQIVAAMAKLNLELGEAATKGNDLSKILKESGVALSDLQGDPVQALLKIVDLFNSTTDAGKRSALSSAAFGKSFKELIPFLAQGSGAIRTKMDEAVISSDALVKKFDDLGDKIAELAENWKHGIGTQLSTSVDELARIVALAEQLQKALFGAGEADPLGKFVEGQAKILHDDLVKKGIISGAVGGQRASPEGGSHPAVVAGQELKIPKELTTEQKKLASEKERQDKAIKKVIDSLILETDNLSRTSREQEIYNRLADAGINISSEQGRVIADLAGKFDDQKVALANLVDEMDFARDATKGFFSDLISGLREGASLTDTLSKAFGNLADTIINKLINQAVDQLLGKSGTGPAEGGLLGQLLSGALTKSGSAAGTSAGGTAPLIGVTGQALGALSKNNAIGSAGQFGQITAGSLSGGMQFADLIKAAASKYGVDPALLAGLIKKESGFNQFAVSPAGAMGLTQLMPGTARDLGVTDPFNAQQNIGGGANFLSQMLKLSGGNVPGALARYNWGPGNFNRNGGMNNLPAETQNYVTQVMKNAKEFSGALDTVSKTAQTSASTFTTSFAPAISSMLSTVVSSIGGLGSGGTVGNIFGRASGGPVFPGRGYVVGENGPELFMPRVPGVISPNGGFGSQKVEVVVRAHPSKYLFLETDQRAATGDARTLNAASRRAPDRMARFNKLGT